jgi:hypothetical protein
MIDAHFNSLFPLRGPTFVCDELGCGGVMANLAGLPRSSGHHPPTRVRRKCRHAAKPVTEPEVRADSIILNVDGSPGCAADSAVDAGRSPSPDLGSELGKSGSATTAVAPAPHGAGTYPDHEPVASGGAQRGSTLQEEAVAGSGTSATGGVAVSSMGKPATASAPKSQSPADVWGLEELIVLLYRKATIAA